MKILIIKDPAVNNTLLGQVQLQLEDIYKRNTGVQLEWAIEEFDYGDYEVEEYLPWRGYFGLQRSFIREKTDEIYRRWGEEVTLVMFMIDSNNWKLTGVWGWNMSTFYNNYGVQQVRFANRRDHTDQRNVNNTVGVMYHEMMHDHDAMVYTYTGKRVEPIVGVENWDVFCVHGGRDWNREGEGGWKYIRYNENQRALAAIKEPFTKALAKRQEVFEERIGLMQRVIQLAEQYIVLLRQKKAQQRGDLPILKDNKCVCQKSVKTQ